MPRSSSWNPFLMTDQEPSVFALCSGPAAPLLLESVSVAKWRQLSAACADQHMPQPRSPRRARTAQRSPILEFRSPRWTLARDLFLSQAAGRSPPGPTQAHARSPGPGSGSEWRGQVPPSPAARARGPGWPRRVGLAERPARPLRAALPSRRAAAAV